MVVGDIMYLYIFTFIFALFIEVQTTNSKIINIEHNLNPSIRFFAILITFSF